MTLLMRVADSLIRNHPKLVLGYDPATEEAGKASNTPAEVPRKLEAQHHVTRETIGGYPVITLTPMHAEPSGDLIYLHGGSYVKTMMRSHWTIIGELLRNTGTRVILPLYPTAPEHQVTDGMRFLDAVLLHTTASGSRPLFLAGDSAGGGFAAALVIRHRETIRFSGVFLFSPWVDISMENPKAREAEARDAMLNVDKLTQCGEMWAGSLGVRHPLVSPIEDSLEQLPPMRIYAGGRDLLLPDIERFAAKAHAAGSPVVLQTFPDGFHVFVGLAAAKETKQVFADIAATVDRKSVV